MSSSNTTISVSLAERIEAIQKKVSLAKEQEEKVPEPIRSTYTSHTPLYVYLKLLTGYERGVKLRLVPYIPYETLLEVYKYLAPIKIPVYDKEVLARYPNYILPVDIKTMASILFSYGNTKAKELPVIGLELQKTIMHCLMEEVL